MRPCAFSNCPSVLAQHTERSSRLQRANALVSHWIPGGIQRGIQSGVHCSQHQRVAASHGSVQNASPASWWQSCMETVANGSIQRMETKVNNFCCQNTAYLEAVDPLETGRFSKWDSLLDSKEFWKQLLDCSIDEKLWTSGGGTKTTLNTGFDGKFTTNNSKH